MKSNHKVEISTEAESQMELYTAAGAIAGISELMQLTNSSELSDITVPNLGSAISIISKSIQNIID